MIFRRMCADSHLRLDGSLVLRMVAEFAGDMTAARMVLVSWSRFVRARKLMPLPMQDGQPRGAQSLSDANTCALRQVTCSGNGTSDSNGTDTTAPAASGTVSRNSASADSFETSPRKTPLLAKGYARPPNNLHGVAAVDTSLRID